jgi:hypothetical protein
LGVVGGLDQEASAIAWRGQEAVSRRSGAAGLDLASDTSTGRWGNPLWKRERDQGASKNKTAYGLRAFLPAERLAFVLHDMFALP